MKAVFLFVLMCLVAVTWSKPESTYTDKYDNINEDEIINNYVILTNYNNCLIDKGPCTPEAKLLKKLLPDALEHDCNRCTERQKSVSEKIIRHIVNKHPELWKELAVKYDPDNIYQEKYKDKIDSIKEA